MSKTRNLLVIFTLVALMVSGLIVNGCAADATEEQLKQIQALEDEIAALKKSMADKNGEKGRVQSDINGKQAKLDRCARDKETVKQRLATFQEPR